MPDLPDLEVHTNGRVLNVWLTGADEGHTLVFHRGTPDPPIPWPAFDFAAAERGLRVVAYARPGYSGSSRHRGRSVADASDDTVMVLDALDVERFVVMGHSGGGPHALACAALLGERCLAAVTLASVAPYHSPDLVWLDGMADENVEEFGAALAGEESLRPYLQNELRHYEEVTAEEVAIALRGLVSDVDKAALTGEMAERAAKSLRRVALDGLDGWVDDDLAFTTDWGFDLESITTPTGIWQGRHDRMVPFNHGRWLVAHIPSSAPRLMEDEGHISLLTNRLADILDDALMLSGLANPARGS